MVYVGSIDYWCEEVLKVWIYLFMELNLALYS